MARTAREMPSARAFAEPVVTWDAVGLAEAELVEVATSEDMLRGEGRRVGEG